MWFGSATNHSKLSSVEKPIKIKPHTMSPSAAVRDLEVFLDSEFNMRSHISRIRRACFYHLCCLRAVQTPTQPRSKITSMSPFRCNSTTATLFWLSSRHQLSHRRSEWRMPLPDWFVTPRQKTTWRQYFSHFTGFWSSRDSVKSNWIWLFPHKNYDP